MKKSDIDINDTIDYALKILTNELKYKVEIEKKYEKIPLIKCHSREIVKAHGGKLDVESVEGKGTTFTICLPGRTE